MTSDFTIPAAASALAGLTSANVLAADNALLQLINDYKNGTKGFDVLKFYKSSATLASDTLALAATGVTRYVVVDTQSAAAFDDLSTISGGSDGQVVYLVAADAGRVITVKHNVGNIKLHGAADVTLSVDMVLKLFYNGSNWSDVVVTTGISPQICNARLTLTSGTAVTTTDVTAATNLYVTPYLGNRLALYNGSNWTTYSFSEITISLSGFTANKNFDVFGYDNGSGTVVAETVVWTNDTTRATGITLQDGVWCKSGTLTKRYLGTFRTTGTTGQCEDSKLRRLVWNADNRVAREISLTETTDSWTYATATWRQWNNSAANRVDFVRGLDEEVVTLLFTPSVTASAGIGAIAGIHQDATSGTPTVLSGGNVTGGTGNPGSSTIIVFYDKLPGIGYHYLQMMEYATGSTVSFYGDAGGTLILSAARGQVMA